jgi:selenocysteine lyase/cysteine desulfurase
VPLSLDIDRVRFDTPGCKEWIHLNNAGAALMPTQVYEAIVAHLTRERDLGGYEAADDVRGDVEGVYSDVARLVGADARNIAIVENASVAFTQALGSFDLKVGDRVVISRADYVSLQLTLLALRKRLRIEVDIAEDLREGGVDPQSIAELARHPKCRFVAVCWMPTNSGLVQDVQSVGEVCARAGIPFVLDACQAVGQTVVDVTRLRCDFLTATARKFLRGPRGIGFLLVSDAMLDRGLYPVTLDSQGAQWTGPDSFELVPTARRYENWEFAYALVMGLGAAARYAAEHDIRVSGHRASALAERLRGRLANIPGCRVLDRGQPRSAIVSAAFDWCDSEVLVRRLRDYGVNTSATFRRWAWYDMSDKGVEHAVRMSPHYYNTEEEIDRVVDIVQEIASKK